ncbi:MAG: hypothetical protein ABI588_06505, partial [Arenimonas sp.]
MKGLKAGGGLRILAVLLVLFAAWHAFGGWQAWSANRLVASAEEAKHKVAADLQPMLGALLTRAGGLAGRADLATAVRAGNSDAAKAIVVQTVPGTEAAMVYAPGFAQAYQDPAAFGYGKLGLLERASQDGKAALAVVKDDGAPHLAIAVPVVEGAQVLGVVYLRQPLAEVLKLVQDAAPGGAYLALRQGTYNVVEAGLKDELRSRPEESPELIAGSNLRVVGMAPPKEPGMFGAGGLGQFGLALALLALAGGAWWFSTRIGRKPAAVAVVEASDEAAPMTLAEMQSAGKVVAPEVSKPVMNTAQQAAMAGIALERSIFRAYDIRGLVGQTLDANIARLIGQA